MTTKALPIRSHPVYEAIHNAAFHGPRAVPTAAELEQLGVGQAVRGKIAAAARKAAGIHDTGDHQSAWRYADEQARELIAGLPEEQRDARYMRAQRDGDLDPRELAAQVPRLHASHTEETT